MSPTRVRDSAQIPIAVLPTSESEALTAAYKQMLQAQQVEFSQKLEEIQAKCSQTLTTMNGEISAVRKELEELQHLCSKTSVAEPEETMDPERGAFWNLNAMAVCFWKSTSWPPGMRWNAEQASFEPIRSDRVWGRWEVLCKNFIWMIWYNVMPVVYSILLLCTLVGVMDEGLSAKQRINGDWWYQSPIWRFARDAEQRADNFSDMGLLADRPALEIDACLRDDYLMPFATYNATGDAGYARFWGLVSDLQVNGSVGPGTWGWATSHCMPWEWANICAVLYSANAAADGGVMPPTVKEAFLQDGLRDVNTYEPRTWYPIGCYPVDFHRRTQLTADLWRSLVVQSPEELRHAAAERRLPIGVAADREQLALWIITRSVSDMKSLDARDDSVSMHLYQRLHFVYNFSFGESSAVELITIIILSVYLFYSSLYNEIRQMLDQVSLSVTLRCYEGAIFGDRSSGPSYCLRAAVRRMKKSATFVDDFCFLCGLVFGDFACDIFLSLRMLIVAQITIACIMFVVLNHGVINVIFSVLAIAFAMEIDDKFMEALVNFGFSETPVYILQIKPALMCVMADDMRTLAMNRRGQDAEGNRTQDAMNPVVKMSRMFMKRNLWGLQIANWWALVLTTALLCDHLYWSIMLSINSGPDQIGQWLNASFQDFVGVPHMLLLTMLGCYCIAVANAVCYQGLQAVPGLMQLGLSTLWVYGMIRNFIVLGVLAWYSDVGYSDGDSFLPHLLAILSEDALYILPTLGLHAAFAVIRPALLVYFIPAEIAAESGGYSPKVAAAQLGLAEFQPQ